jgi:hypothetical protein
MTADQPWTEAHRHMTNQKSRLLSWKEGIVTYMYLYYNVYSIKKEAAARTGFHRTRGLNDATWVFVFVFINK